MLWINENFKCSVTAFWKHFCLLVWYSGCNPEVKKVFSQGMGKLMCKSSKEENNLTLTASPDQRVVQSLWPVWYRKIFLRVLAVPVKEQGQCRDRVLPARLHVSSVEHPYVSVCIWRIQLWDSSLLDLAACQQGGAEWGAYSPYRLGTACASGCLCRCWDRSRRGLVIAISTTGMAWGGGQAAASPTALSPVSAVPSAHQRPSLSLCQHCSRAAISDRIVTMS